MQQLYLTPRSQPLLKKISDNGAERQDQVMAGLNEAERDAADVVAATHQGQPVADGRTTRSDVATARALQASSLSAA